MLCTFCSAARDSLERPVDDDALNCSLGVLRSFYGLRTEYDANSHEGLLGLLG